jgi:hypothetical protein
MKHVDKYKNKFMTAVGTLTPKGLRGVFSKKTLQNGRF